MRLLLRAWVVARDTGAAGPAPRTCCNWSTSSSLLSRVPGRLVKIVPAGSRALGVGRAHPLTCWLDGDSIDNVPVSRIGEKTAVDLMSRYGSLEALYERLAEITKPALKRRLTEHREQAFLSRELITLRGDLDLGLTLDQLPVAPIRRDDLLSLARRYEIKRLEAIATQQGVETGAAGAPVASRPFESAAAARRSSRGTGVKAGGTSTCRNAGAGPARRDCSRLPRRRPPAPPRPRSW